MYAKIAYDKAAEFLIGTVSDEVLCSKEFSFLNSPLSPISGASNIMFSTAVREFFIYLPIDEQSEIISEAAYGNEGRFPDDPWRYIEKYLAIGLEEHINERIKNYAKSREEYYLGKAS